MESIRHSKTLFYYDGPQVFEARDGIGGNYVGVMVEPEGGQNHFPIKGVSPNTVTLAINSKKNSTTDERDERR